MASETAEETDEQFRARIRGEQKAWREYSLCLMYPPRVPDDYPDSQVSADLKFLADNTRLPWEIDSEFFERELWKETTR